MKRNNPLTHFAFLPLKAYDIFLLLMLLAVCSLIRKIPRNYREGKCLFFTAIGLLSFWFLWILIFICIHPDYRDIVVVFAMILTAYGIISGMLLPRVYFMLTHPKSDKTFQGHVEGANLRFEPRRRTVRQVKSLSITVFAWTHSFVLFISLYTFGDFPSLNFLLVF